jgi:hypothetical protein
VEGIQVQSRLPLPPPHGRSEICNWENIWVAAQTDAAESNVKAFRGWRWIKRENQTDNWASVGRERQEK